MRKKLVLLAIVAAGLATPPAKTAMASAAPTIAVKTCGAGYGHAYLRWDEKCFRAGQFCKVGNRAYLRYGFVRPPSQRPSAAAVKLGLASAPTVAAVVLATSAAAVAARGPTRGERAQLVRVVRAYVDASDCWVYGLIPRDT